MHFNLTALELKGLESRGVNFVVPFLNQKFFLKCPFQYLRLIYEESSAQLVS